VVAVPDPRTESIIVSASTELMPQIAQMIAQLDSSPAKKQRVYVYSLKNADVQQTTEILRGMFERSNTQGNRNQAGNQNSVLNSRSTANQQTTPGAVGFGAQGGNTTRGSGQTFR
jgi:type II secretory pathway component GspD/PulD (secretin)